jgi:hypothetical protein
VPGQCSRWGSAISFQSLPRQQKGIIIFTCAVRRAEGAAGGGDGTRHTHPALGLQRWRLDLVVRIHAHSFLRTPPTAFIPLLSEISVQRPPLASRLSPRLNSSTCTCSFRQRDIINPIRGFHLVRSKHAVLSHVTICFSFNCSVLYRHCHYSTTQY